MRSTAAAILAGSVLAAGCSSTDERIDQVRDSLDTPACTSGQTRCACSEGETRCGLGASFYCANLSYDKLDCGGCGVACGRQQLCHQGHCINLCEAARTFCNGACFNLDSDVHHCGRCDRACGDGQMCSRGSCVDHCPSGESQCGGVCTEISKDPANCGRCGDSCGPGSCVDGWCVPGCPESTPDRCTRADGTRSCTNRYRDHDDCGTCGHVCGREENCLEGQCARP